MALANTMSDTVTPLLSSPARPRRPWATALASLGLLLLLGMMATAIVLSQNQSKERLLSNLHLRGTSSAQFVSTYLEEQARREQQAARRFLAAADVSRLRFELVTGAFGSNAAVLLDRSGRLLDVIPAKSSLLGRPIASHYAHLAAAEQGAIAFSNVVPSAVRGAPVMAVAVPFSTPRGRRVFSAAYPAAGSALDALVDHTISYRAHQVFLVDGVGRLLAASPRTGASTLAEVDPQLARAAAHGSVGSVAGAASPTTFTVASVPGTSWRLVIAVPNSRLYASVTGATSIVPWVVFALVAVLGGLLIALFARSLADRERLASLSSTLEITARTDALTGLYNRRALNEQLRRVAASARRRVEPLSVLMIDLDRFKETNDGFGHEAGDRVLCAVADCLRDVVRGDDVYGRWGGDEFLVVLPSTNDAGARKVAKRIRAAAADVDLSDIGLPHGVPLSVGSATGLHTNPHDLVRAADVALYRVKSAHSDEVVSTTHR
jgi:diguanylate cyclase (GGDEF)-like protein